MGRIAEKIAGSMAAVAVAGLGVTAAFVGPFAVRGPAHVIVTETPCGRADARGCFDPKRPNEIQVWPDALPVTIAHENMHRSLYAAWDARWADECYVSARVLAETGLQDAYALAGHCD